MNNLVCPQTAMTDSSENRIQTQMGMICKAPAKQCAVVSIVLYKEVQASPRKQPQERKKERMPSFR